jgi:hypothetical protein
LAMATLTFGEMMCMFSPIMYILFASFILVGW